MEPKELALLALSIVDKQERWRGFETINLIASENVMSPAARRALSSDFWHRYAEGPIGHRLYQGCKFVDEVEQLCVDLFKELYGAEYADVRPISGAVANMATYYAFAKPGDVTMSLSVPDGAHISYTEFGSAGYRGVSVVHIPFDRHEATVDVEKFREVVANANPAVVMLGGSLFLFPLPLEELASASREAGAVVVYDGAHVMGLILGGKFQDPLREGATVLSGSTHKTLPGPQGGVVMTNDAGAFKRLQGALFPGLVSNHHLHRLPSLAITLAEMKAFGKEYAGQIVENAKALGKALHDEGFDVLWAHKGFTESHQVAVDVSEFGGGAVAELLERGNIVVNKNLLPGDDVKRADSPSGIRLGTQEVTRWGMKEAEMGTIAEFVRRLVIDGEDPNNVKKDVVEFRKSFRRVAYCFDL